MKIDLFRDLQELRARLHPAAVVTDPASGAQALVTGENISGTLDLSEAVAAQVRQMLHEDASASFEGLFVRVYGPPWSLLLIGAVHISQALAPMAGMAGFAVTVIDPRGAFATPERFPGVDLVSEWPQKALAALPPTERTAVVTLTHDPKIDDPGLIAALRSPAFFIGALGSARTHNQRKERLASGGFTADQIARIAGPVGLDLGARSPGEIAVSVLAEIVGARHGRRRVRP